MKKLCALSFTLILMSLISSCEKNRETDIEIIQNELNHFVNDNNISKCDIVVILGDQYSTYYSSVSFSIDNGFVIVRDDSNNIDKYNLLFLSRYALQTFGEKKIIMFFSS
jgi:hypothetical protein